MIKKKGEMTLKQIAITLFLIASFAIILFWYLVIFKPNSILNEQVCHNSVVMRDNVNIKVTGGSLVESVPLRCKAEKICYTKQGKGSEIWDKVKQVFGSQVDKVTCPKTHQKIVVKNKEELIADLVKRQAKWWAIFGEGKLDFEPKGLFDWTSTYCLPSTQIFFDGSIVIDEDMNYITYGELWQYMESHKVPHTEKNYLEYLYGFSKIDNNRIEKMNEDYGFKNSGMSIENFGIDTSLRDYVIITGMAKSGWLKTGTGIGVEVGMIFFPYGRVLKLAKIANFFRAGKFVKSAEAAASLASTAEKSAGEFLIIGGTEKVAAKEVEIIIPSSISAIKEGIAITEKGSETFLKKEALKIPSESLSSKILIASGKQIGKLLPSANQVKSGIAVGVAFATLENEKGVSYIPPAIWYAHDIDKVGSLKCENYDTFV